MIGKSLSSTPIAIKIPTMVVNAHDKWSAHQLVHHDGLDKFDYTENVNGHPIRVRLWDGPGGDPNGPILVLMHGLGGSSTDSRKPIRMLLPHCSRAISVDLPNHGQSESLGQHVGPPPVTMYHCINDVNRLVTHAVDARLASAPLRHNVVVVGHSLGGYEAAKYALTTKRAGSVRRLMLVSPDGGHFTPSQLGELRDTLDMGSSHRKAVKAAELVWPGSRIKAHVMAPFMRAIFAKPQMRYLVHSDVLQPELSRDQLVKLPPVSLFWGTKERAQAPGCFQYLSANLPAGSLVVQPAGVAHGDFPSAPPALMTPMIQHLKIDS